MPQGDLVFFPYDATVVLGGYLGGYTLFVGWLAPRVVLTLKVRGWTRSAWIAAGPPAGDLSGRGYRFPALETLGAALTATSETALAFVQFGLLALLVYQVGRSALVVDHPGLTPGVAHPVRPPSFGVTTVVATNLVHLWTHHRGSLFVRPATHHLAGLVVGALARLGHPGGPRVLPRLLGVVKSSRGLNV